MADMTPEERAKTLVLSRRAEVWFDGATVGTFMGNTEAMVADIAAALRDAIKQERYACAKECADAGEFDLADQLLARK